MASLLLPCLTLLCVLPHCSVANIILGSSLSTTGDNSSWVSPLGDFAFGFRKLSNDPNLFLLAIWYNKISDETIVWQANDESNHNPVGPVQGGSTLQLTEAGLELKDHRGDTKWVAKPNTTVSDAAMLDQGNFVLRGSGSGSASASAYAWESFNNPTDTILPNQTLGSGSVLFSKLTETNFSKGRYQLQFSDGNLQLVIVAWPTEYIYEAYYTSETRGENSSHSGHQLVFQESGNISIQKNNGENVPLRLWVEKETPGENRYYRATLDFDGVFTLYAHERNSDDNYNWRPLGFIPGNICEATYNESGLGGGACGFNSYCEVNGYGKPSCMCPPDYVYVDPNNKLGGCTPNFIQSCAPDERSRNPKDLFVMKELDRSANWPTGDYERLAYNNRSDCEESCLHDCSCAVVIFNGADCWKKKLPLSNGIITNEGVTKPLFKVRKGDSRPLCKKEKSILFGAFLLGGFAIINLVLLVLIIFLIVFWWQKRKNGQGKNVRSSSFSETNFRFFTYDQLYEATNGFQEEVGRGSFGIVYKGVLTTGSRNVIAVKKLDKLAQEREREFRTEVEAIIKTHHRNLVQLLGFCNQGVNRLLVYEFMSNGTLANFLFSLPRPAWNLRVRISLEIARGLLYLHEECNVPIIHCDIKPQNILLDEYFVAKISDFGLSKLLLSDQSRTRTMIRGTRGYVAPEWFKNVPVSAKVDVYSYGVMLLEIICCRRSVEMELEENKAILTDWAYDCYNEGRLDVLVNEEKDAMADKFTLQNWLRVAIWCIQEDPSIRPTMKMVLHMLEGFLEVPEPPGPSFCVAVEK